MPDPVPKFHVGHRIVVTGMAGAGKSTMSKQLAIKTGLPLIHLDLHSWDPGWVRVPTSRLLEKQKILLGAAQWIVDSNDVDDELLLVRAERVTDEWGIVWRNWRNRTSVPERDRALADRCRGKHVHSLSTRLEIEQFLDCVTQQVRRDSTG